MRGFLSWKALFASEKCEKQCSATHKNVSFGVICKKLLVLSEIPSVQFNFHHLGDTKPTHIPTYMFVDIHNLC